MNSDLAYVFGHKNPDTDSVVAAISLAYLKNKLGMNCVPAILGELNPETKFVLNQFDVAEPIHLDNVKLQLKDVSYHKKCFVDKNVSIKDAFDYINKYSLTGIPVVESKNRYYGYVSLKEIARALINGDYHRIDTSYGNLINILKGNKVLKFDREIKGTAFAVTYSKESFANKIPVDNSYILILGDREDVLEYAINCKAKLIILVAGATISPRLLDLAIENKVNIITTDLTSYEVGKLISLSNYIKNYMRETESITFNEVDYLSDFIDKSKKLKHTNYPILNNKNECLGVLTLTDTNEVKKKQVILVDHNNFSQSVDGLEEADILEIVDHHNIGDIVTKKPINFRNSFCGCVNTIIYDLYVENNIEIPKNIAGLMASAIISDTLLLTSPTTTIKDSDALISLSEIAGLNYKDYGMKMLKAGMSIKGYSNDQLLHKDFKSYKLEKCTFGIGQILTADVSQVRAKFDSLVEFLNEFAENKDYKLVSLFVTDIFNKKSYCLYNESASDIIKESFKLNDIYEGVPLKGILSRKMQIVPYIMTTLDR